MSRTRTSAPSVSTRGPRVRAGLAAGALLAGLGAGVVLAAPASATPSQNVTICHATHARSNPYVVITVDTSSIDEIANVVYNGHGDHVGPVFDPADPSQKEWGDIIPSFTSPDGSVFPGLNAEAGADILAAGCEAPQPQESEEPSDAGTPTGEPSEQPEEGAPSADPTDPPAETTTPAPQTSQAEAGTTEQPEAAPQLAVTGPVSPMLLGAGAALVALGSAALGLARRGAHA